MKLCTTSSLRCKIMILRYLLELSIRYRYFDQLTNTISRSFPERKERVRVPFRLLFLREPIWVESIRIGIKFRIPVQPQHRNKNLLILLQYHVRSWDVVVFGALSSQVRNRWILPQCFCKNFITLNNRRLRAKWTSPSITCPKYFVSMTAS